MAVPDVQSVAEAIAQTLAANYTTVAFVMVLLYDYVLTFGEEVEFVWKQSVNSGKILFLLNRYIPLIDLVILMNSYTNRAIQDDKFCLPWFQVDSWVGMLSIIVVDILMLLRTWALWRRSKIILIFLIILLVCCVLAASGPTLYVSLNVVRTPSPENIRPCESAFPRTELLYGVWASFIVFDSVIVVLTLIRVVPTFNLSGSTPLISQLLKDGLQYFSLILLASVANIVVISVAPPALATMLFTFYRVTATTLTSRLVLNLRGSIMRPAYNEEDTKTELNMIMFTTKPEDTFATRYSMEDIEDPEGAAARRQSRQTKGSRRTSHSKTSSDHSL